MNADRFFDPHNWIAPSVAIGLCSAAFAMGVIVGENRNASLIAALETRITAHERQPLHELAVSETRYESDRQNLAARLDDIREHLRRIQAILDASR